MSHRSKPFDAAVRVVQILAVTAGCLSALSYWVQRGSFWEDEIIAATHGLEPLPRFFMEVIRNDIHPFAYFLLLKWWALPAPGSDAWMLASSLASAGASAAVLAYAAYRERGRDAALWAAGLFCLLPPFTWSAGNLRMYGLLPAIAVGCWLANRGVLRHGGGWRAGTLVVLQLVLAYSHAIGFVFAGFIALAALVECRPPLTGSRMTLWGAGQALTLAGILPLIASALMRGTEPLAAPSPLDLALLPARTLSVSDAAESALVFGGLTFLFLVAFALTDRLGRILVLMIPGGALLACVLAALAGKPMFKPPVFAANLGPFLALAAGFGLAGRRDVLPRIFAAAGMVAMAAALWVGAVDRGLSGNYQPAALYLTANAQPGDLVVVPTPSVFWGIMRYAVGAHWGQPLEIMALQDTGPWQKLKGKLGPEWCRRLGLIPQTNHVDRNGVRFVIGTDLGAEATTRLTLWVVHRRNYQDRGQENLTLPAFLRQERVRSFGDELTVTRFVHAGGPPAQPN